MTELERITKHTVMETGEKVFEFKVITGAYSDSTKMKYKWRAVRYDTRSMDLQVDFEYPIYISMEEEPEYIEVVINDGSIFMSKLGLPLDIANTNNTNRLLEGTKRIELVGESQSPLILRKRIPKQ